MITIEEALIELRLGPGINEDVDEQYAEAAEIGIKAIEIIKDISTIINDTSSVQGDTIRYKMICNAIKEFESEVI